MALLKKRVEAAGFDTYRYCYPALKRSFHENVSGLEALIRQLLCEKGYERLHLVCHSYGGLVACGLLEAFWQNRAKIRCQIDKCVFLGTPLNGATLVRRLEGTLVLELLTGHSLAPLRRGVPPKPSFTIDSIMVAGTLNIGFGMFFLEDGDGMVAVADTLAPWLSGHFKKKVTHLGLLLSSDVAGIVTHFLSQK
ncbi:MAG: alpha/beta hydrolase [Thermodesulfobacteria bacterium]|nr:alpha/beta hydrolase [Thermodesulfobacteriota bacterium]